MKQFKRKFIASFTLVELLIVLVVLGILVSLTLPGFTKTKERAYDREAQTNLRLIQQAEKIYRVENGVYYPNTPFGSITEYNIDQINQNLRLDINERVWNYTLGGGNGSWYNAFAERIIPPNGYDRQWSYLVSPGDPPDPEIVCDGNGCP